jgi:LysM repeat protein
MRYKRHLGFAFVLVLVFILSSCDTETLSGEFRTVVAPQAQTVAAQGGLIAQTQAAKLLQAAQVKVATESAILKETAKVEAATAAAQLIDTAQARLVTQSAGKVTAAPTNAINLKNTAEALVKTQVVGRAPVLQTQAAILAATVEARLATETGGNLPSAFTQGTGIAQQAPAIATEAVDLVETARSSIETQAASLSLVWIPSATPAGVISSIVVYIVREGDTLATIAAQFGIPVERIIFLNQYRYPWLVGSPQNLSPGMALVMAVFPGNDSSPVSPSGQAAWSVVPGCNVIQVDWLLPPINCRPAEIDVVTRVAMTVGCVSLSNPLGYTLNHEVLTGWMLTGSDGTSSYSWFADHDRNVVIIGPAIVMEKQTYTECRLPSSRP